MKAVVQTRYGPSDLLELREVAMPAVAEDDVLVRKLEMLRLLGADEVVDGTQQDFTEGTARYDLVFDVPGNRPVSSCRRVLEPHGRYVLVGHEGFGAAATPCSASSRTSSS